MPSLVVVVAVVVVEQGKCISISTIINEVGSLPSVPLRSLTFLERLVLIFMEVAHTEHPHYSRKRDSYNRMVKITMINDATTQ